MKRWMLAILTAVLLQGTVCAVSVPDELWESLPEAAENILEEIDPDTPGGITKGIGLILGSLGEQVEEVLHQRVGNAAAVLLVAVLCGLISGFSKDGLGKPPPFLDMAGGVTIAMLTAGSLESLMGLGAETIRQLHTFSQALLPTLAAAVAAGGMVSGAAVQQIGTALCVDLLLNLIHGLLLPLLYLYVGGLTAGICLGDRSMQAVASGMRKGITWLLTTAMVAFTFYLSLVRIVSGTADGMAVRITKSVLSGVIPVVGGIISEVSETLLVGAGMVKNTIGIVGMLAILAVCMYPFLQLGLQYLLYKAAAFFAEVVGTPSLCKLISGLGGAFGLMLGMTGACALLLLVSVLAAVSMVVI